MALPLRSFAFPHSEGSPNSLTMKDPPDVGTLSCRDIKPLSKPLPSGIRFFQHPSPTSRPVPLASHCPRPWGMILGYHVPPGGVHGVRCLLSTGKLCWSRERISKSFSHFQYRLVQALKPLPLVHCHDLYRRFTYVHHTHLLALTRLCGYPEGASLTRCAPQGCPCFRHCQARSLFRTLASSGDTDGFFLFSLNE